LSSFGALFSPSDREERHVRSEVARLSFVVGLTDDEIALKMDMSLWMIRRAKERIREERKPMSRMTEPDVPEKYYGMPVITMKDMLDDIKDADRIIKANELYLSVQPFQLWQSKK